MTKARHATAIAWWVFIDLTTRIFSHERTSTFNDETYTGQSRNRLFACLRRCLRRECYLAMGIIDAKW